ncbi:uncharacterized protein LY79DRAFT_571654, partial [Colletotrichum navitas]
MAPPRRDIAGRWWCVCCVYGVCVSDVACRPTCEVTFGAFVPRYFVEVGVGCTLKPAIAMTAGLILVKGSVWEMAQGLVLVYVACSSSPLSPPQISFSRFVSFLVV